MASAKSLIEPDEPAPPGEEPPVDLKAALEKPEDDKENKGRKEDSRRSHSRSGSRRRRPRSSERRSRSPSPRRRKPSPPPKKICIQKLTRNVTKDHVLEIFGNYGNITYIDVPNDKSKPWIPNGMAYVEFEKIEEADDAIKKMDGGKANFCS